MKRADSGFEDRGDHQAPFTLRIGDVRSEIENSPRLPFGPCGLEDSFRLGELAGGEFGMNLLPIDRDFKSAAA